jgi:hypothetical protein
MCDCLEGEAVKLVYIMPDALRMGSARSNAVTVLPSLIRPDFASAMA